MKLRYRSMLFKLPLLRRYSAIVLGRRCYVKSDQASQQLIRHALIHQEQMDRHGVVGFYFIYLRDYGNNLIKYRNHDEAYAHIPFEIEAYTREREPEDTAYKLEE